MSENGAARLAADPRVRSVSPDLVVHAFAKPVNPNQGGGNTESVVAGSSCPDLSSDPAFAPTANETPTGVSRISVDLATTTGVGVKVAVIDTGIDPCHPDLQGNYKGGKNLRVKRDQPPKDDNGHGTHVAGIIGAAQNGFGVVGVAPEVALYAVKVLDSQGSGSLSTVIKGLDWAVKNGMQVANLSLGAFDLSLGTGPMCTAVTNAVKAGVTVVAAAGNDAFDAVYFTPANCLYSLTVSAFADADGAPGGTGGSITFSGRVENDDTFAQTFSNYSNYCWDLDKDGVCTDADSPVVDLMAPGVAIHSTMPTYPVTLGNSPYGTLTGTSMATPHVTGAAALYLQAHPGVLPKQVRLGLTTSGECVGGVGTGGPLTCPMRWTDDPDFAWEPLVSALGL